MSDTMTENEVRKVVKEAVRETLTTLGFDTDDPLEAQRDMQFVRSWRKSTDTMKRQGLVSAIGVLTVGFLGAVGLVIREWFSHSPPT